MQNIEKLIEGTYQYFQNGQNYSQENFYIEQIEETKDVIYSAEILSRADSGEFFKMHVTYAVNQFHAVQSVTIEKSLGERYAKETFNIDQNTQQLIYTFKNSSYEKTIERPFSSKHFISAPCFLTSALFTLTKKIETTARTPVTFITTKNDWEYVEPPKDHILWVEMKAHDNEELVINGSPLTANKYDLYEEDAMASMNSNCAQLWVSKLFGLPYQFEEKDGSKIVIRKLKKLKQEIEKIKI
ncbi:MAG: hypothetical protein K2P81_10990 [Bacteriovoracaceae bacterium]|nr:hypothetical protein [Bacteriovoracaceae bacterium]